MPSLLIGLQNQIQWVVTVANTNITYNFAGATTQLQASSVRYLAMEMEAGQGGFEVDNLQSILQLGNAQPADVFQQLFADTDGVVLNGNPVFACYDEDDTLIDVLDEAGEALAAAMG